MRGAGVGRIVAVVGHRAEDVMSCLEGVPDVIYARQAEQRGTGDATLCGLRALHETGYSGKVIVSMGDKIVAPDVLADLVLNEKKAAKVLAAAEKGLKRACATLCGRTFTADEILATPYANAGLYRFNADAIAGVLEHIGSDNAQGEIYLTDALERFAEEGQAELFEVRDADDMLTYSTRPELRRMSHAFMRPASELLAAVESSAMRETLADLYGDACAAAAETRYARILRGFIGRYGDRRAVIARAPGRVNLMGRHIDHRGGGVNVIAMGFDTVMVAAPRDDHTVSVANIDQSYPDGTFQIEGIIASSGAPVADTTAAWLDFLASPPVAAELEQTRGSWINYVKAAILRFRFAADIPLCGMDIMADGNIPPAAGLSSSSSIVVTAAEAVTVLNCLNVDPRRFAERSCKGSIRSLACANSATSPASAPAPTSTVFYASCRKGPRATKSARFSRTTQPGSTRSSPPTPTPASTQ